MKQRLILLSLAFLLGTAAFAAPKDSVTLRPGELAEQIIAEARTHLGKAYRHGGNGPKVFDCTGFTKYVYAQFGYDLGRTVPGQAADGREITGSYADLQKGDILLFGARHNKKKLGHAAIFIEADSTGTDFTFIHAARGGVMINRISERYYAERFLGVRRILPDFLPDAAEETVPDDLSGLVAPPDTLRLGEDDRRIVLLASGTWAYIGADGAIEMPDADAPRLILRENGSWQSVPASPVTVPLVDLKAHDAAVKAEQKSTAPADGTYHRVVSGDSLSKIAKKYNTTVDQLCRLNGIKSSAVLKVGQKIRVR